MPDINIWYGPDSYMGANIKELFQQMTKMTDEEIAEIHPAHNRDSIRSLLPHLHFYQVVFFFFFFGVWGGVAMVVGIELLHLRAWILPFFSTAGITSSPFLRSSNLSMNCFMMDHTCRGV